MPRLQMCYARGDSYSRRDLADCAGDHAEVLGAPSLAEPHRAQPETLGGLRLTDDRAGIGDTSGKHIGSERRTAQPTVIHDRYSDSSVQYSGKGFLMAYTSTRGDVGDRVGEVLQAWLPLRLAAAEATAFEVSDFTAAPAGYSGRTVFFAAAWTDHAGIRHAEDL